MNMIGVNSLSISESVDVIIRFKSRNEIFNLSVDHSSESY